ncbi:hypothetical protein C5Y96_25540 [Blastopirellula marina]|uniref:DUF1641 domain-containing protein n=1 Tax=Blastopirellula marina TaxID=124 RepID=A0A2S8EZC3_9BACT|nr:MULTISPECIES: DUF1641 domain-containing protein [Pirellulaceae]PQO25270.1 hypothetical protein C5Y96_25540 [Blastopirellula marina]RCS41703.1 DUF1641 domain-containing protein [Bremerella cremea]
MINTTTQARSQSLAERLNDPRTQEMLHRLLDHAEVLDNLLAMAQDVPNLVAIATDLFDAVARQAADQNIDLEQRATQLLLLFKKATDPENLQALNVLVDHLPQLEKAAEMSDDLPNLIAVATDVFDEWAAELKADGVELEQSVRNGLRAALYLGGQIRREELDRLGYLLKSDVLSQHSVETVSLMGSALSSCRQGSCEHPVPERMGLMGLLSASRDSNTQRALAFAVQFGKCFGNLLDKNHPSTSPDVKN